LHTALGCITPSACFLRHRLTAQTVNIYQLRSYISMLQVECWEREWCKGECWQAAHTHWTITNFTLDQLVAISSASATYAGKGICSTAGHAAQAGTLA